jgi:hypothetical protein
MNIGTTLKNGVNNTIKALTNIFGIQAEIYKPITSTSERGVFSNDSIEFEKDPYFSGKVLLPVIFKEKASGLNIADDILDDTFLYVPGYINIYRFSRVSVKLKTNKIEEFIVEDIIDIDDDEQVIFRNYKIIPFTNNDLENAISNEVIYEKDEEQNEDIEFTDLNFEDFYGSEKDTLTNSTNTTNDEDIFIDSIKGL